MLVGILIVSISKENFQSVYEENDYYEMGLKDYSS